MIEWTCLDLKDVRKKKKLLKKWMHYEYQLMKKQIGRLKK